MKIIECPRDALQGLATFIPTETKISYLNQLLKVGFDTLDFGSFVSPKAVPQMRDTEQVLQALDLTATSTKLLAIIANRRGAEMAFKFPQITYLGFPLSISETFQQRNTRKSIKEALELVIELQHACGQKGKILVVYLSMGFGNPYGDPYSPMMLHDFLEKLSSIGVKVTSLSDTVGTATPELVEEVFTTLIPQFPQMEIGAHLHSSTSAAKQKAQAAIKAGCTRFDGAIGGMGGCPMAKDELTGNMPTEVLYALASETHQAVTIEPVEWEKALAMQRLLFAQHS